MPELPEVEVVRRGLAQWVTGRTIAEVEVRHPRAVRRHLEGAEHFVAALTGRTFTATHRRGKYLWLPMAEPDGTPDDDPPPKPAPPPPPSSRRPIGPVLGPAKT